MIGRFLHGYQIDLVASLSFFCTPCFLFSCLTQVFCVMLFARFVYVLFAQSPLTYQTLHLIQYERLLFYWIFFFTPFYISLSATVITSISLSGFLLNNHPFHVFDYT